MSTAIERRKYTVPQLARLWGVSTNKVVSFIRRGDLRAVNLASHRSTRPRYYVDIDDVAAFEASRQVVPDGGESTTRKLRRRTPGTVKEFFS
jgi:hypothetical protein